MEYDLKMPQSYTVYQTRAIRGKDTEHLHPRDVKKKIKVKQQTLFPSVMIKIESTGHCATMFKESNLSFTRHLGNCHLLGYLLAYMFF